MHFAASALWQGLAGDPGSSAARKIGKAGRVARRSRREHLLLPLTALLPISGNLETPVNALRQRRAVLSPEGAGDLPVQLGVTQPPK